MDGVSSGGHVQTGGSTYHEAGLMMLPAPGSFPSGTTTYRAKAVGRPRPSSRPSSRATAPNADRHWMDTVEGPAELWKTTGSDIGSFAGPPAAAETVRRRCDTGLEALSLAGSGAFRTRDHAWQQALNDLKHIKDAKHALNNPTVRPPPEAKENVDLNLPIVERMLEARERNAFGHGRLPVSLTYSGNATGSRPTAPFAKRAGEPDILVMTS